MNKEELINSLKGQGFSPLVINAFYHVEREKFVPENLQGYAYEDIPLPIETGATISQPSTVAFMLDILEIKSDSKILEIGSGSGYALALISFLTNNDIYGVEINQRLAVKSKNILENEKRIHVINKSGVNGLPEHATYDRILVSAAFLSINKVRNLLSQLKDNGILVAPVGNTIYKRKKENGKITEKEFPGFVFVPMQDEDNK